MDAEQSIEELEEEVGALAGSKAKMRVEVHEAHCQVRRVLDHQLAKTSCRFVFPINVGLTSKRFHTLIAALDVSSSVFLWSNLDRPADSAYDRGEGLPSTARGGHGQLAL